MKFNTKAIHAGQSAEPVTGAVMPPVFQTSTYVQEAPGRNSGYDYSRAGNPTRTALEKLIAGLEEADHCTCFASGCAALDAILKMFRPGDHIISTEDIYGGSYRLFRKVFEPYGIRFSFVDMTRPRNVEKALQENTKLIWIETPTNPLLRVIDIGAISAIARNKGILSAVDNTFASPYLQRPLSLGADLVMHSTTKYLGGHSDVIGGAVATSNSEVAEKLRFQAKTTGAIPGPMDCYLVLRGIKTLHVRMERSTFNAAAIAEFLQSRNEIDQVNYPGLNNHPQHRIAAAQMDDFGAMVSFTLRDAGRAAAERLMSRTRIFALAESLGGVESLISHPASMTHASIPKKVREKAGVTESLIRLSVGIEDIDDLKEDLSSAF